MRITTPSKILEGDSIEAILKEHGKECLRGANLTGVIFTDAHLRGANLAGASLNGASLNCTYLYGANLAGASLRDANLIGALLIDASLYGVNLRGASLRGANLYGADLRGADLRDADLACVSLRDADLNDADLNGADLRGADLRGADLYGTNFFGACLQGAEMDECDAKRLSILPDTGSFTGWKKAYDDDNTPVIVKLFIPSSAHRSNSTGRKCRADKAVVLDVQDLDGNSLPPDTTAHSSYDYDFIYRQGETVTVPDFDTNRWNECAPGIHFFITRVEAVKY